MKNNMFNNAVGLKLKALRKFYEDKKIIIVDNKNEYKKLAKILGIELIIVAPSSLKQFI